MEVSSSLYSLVLSNCLKALSNLPCIEVIYVEVLPCALNYKLLKGKEGKPLVVSISVGTREPSRVLSGAGSPSICR